ncbi:hypothetical protein M3Y96_01163400 [Aphelenchoides besseyi]|nr:hypothetical protein M3Y96_01163400 [Aphelenchoides besseyi]
MNRNRKLFSIFVCLAITNIDSWCIRKNPLQFNGMCPVVRQYLQTREPEIRIKIHIGNYDAYLSVVGPSFHLVFGDCKIRFNLVAGINRTVFVTFVIDNYHYSIPTHSFIRLTVSSDHLVIYDHHEKHTMDCESKIVKLNDRKYETLLQLYIENGIEGSMLEIENVHSVVSFFSSDKSMTFDGNGEQEITMSRDLLDTWNEGFRFGTIAIAFVIALVLAVTAIMHVVILCQSGSDWCKDVDDD